MKKFLCLRTILLSCIACCIMVVPVVAFAVPMIYTYQGNYFNEFVDNSPPDGQYTTSDRLEISLYTIDGLLPDSAGGYYDVAPYLSRWTAFDGRSHIDSNQGAEMPGGIVEVSGGEIVEWNIGIRINQLIPSTNYYEHTVWSGSGLAYSPIDDHGFILQLIGDGPGMVTDSGTIRENPGSWSQQHSTVPEPTTMMLFGAGLVGLAGFGRKKLKK